MASELHVDAIKHSGGTSALTIDSGGVVTLSSASYPQVFHSRATGSQDITSSYTDISGCVLTGITPRSSSSKFLITGNFYANLNGATGFRVRLIKTVGGSDTTIYEQRNTYAMYQNEGGDHHQNHVTFLDTPSTASVIGYKFQVIEHNTETMTLNQGDYSSITVQEYLG